MLLYQHLFMPVNRSEAGNQQITRRQFIMESLGLGMFGMSAVLNIVLNPWIESMQTQVGRIDKPKPDELKNAFALVSVINEDIQAGDTDAVRNIVNDPAFANAEHMISQDDRYKIFQGRLNEAYSLIYGMMIGGPLIIFMEQVDNIITLLSRKT